MRTMITNLEGEKELVNLPKPFFEEKGVRPDSEITEVTVAALYIGPKSKRMFAYFFSWYGGRWRTEEVDLPTFLKYCDKVGIDAPDSIEAVEV